jgi:hypothetical protein
VRFTHRFGATTHRMMIHRGMGIDSGDDFKSGAFGGAPVVGCGQTELGSRGGGCEVLARLAFAR